MDLERAKPERAQELAEIKLVLDKLKNEESEANKATEAVGLSDAEKQAATARAKEAKERVEQYTKMTSGPALKAFLEADSAAVNLRRLMVGRVLGIRSMLGLTTAPELKKSFNDYIGVPHAWLQAFDDMTAELGRTPITAFMSGGAERTPAVDFHRDIARYNGALRRVLGRYYADVANQMVNGPQGLLQNVDRVLRWSGAEVGAWNSQTLLASNRLSARMDPSAVASAVQSDPIKALQGTLMLANLLASTESGNVPGVLKQLKDQQDSERKEPAAVYGVGTGNVFEVTPVLDPTGQAMRFRFNYVASTRVREPGGVSDPQLNHIEQNSINTEVVLDNLAIRRVSSFFANTQLGLPAAKSGGLPIFKDLPFFKEIPLIGWFTYRIGGRRPVVQQSLILTQAAIYPTLEDVVGSLAGGR